MSPESVTDVIYYTSCRRRCHLFYRKQTRYIFRNKTKIYGISVSIRICYCLLTGKPGQAAAESRLFCLKTSFITEDAYGKANKKSVYYPPFPHGYRLYRSAGTGYLQPDPQYQKGYNSPSKRIGSEPAGKRTPVEL